MGNTFRILRMAYWWELAPLAALMVTVGGFTLLAEGLRRQAAAKHEEFDYGG